MALQATGGSVVSHAASWLSRHAALMQVVAMEPDESETVALRASAFLPAHPCQVRWRRSARARRVSLRIDARAGEVVVTLPLRAGRRAGMALLTTHAAWVMKSLAALAPPVVFAPGVAMPLGGIDHVIRHEPARRGTHLEAGAIVVSGDPAFLRRRVADFLRAEAKRRIAARAVVHAAALGVKPKAIRLKDTHSRWGSCAPDGTLAFSWRLVMAPDWVLDYVVAHEVAHLRELNHSHRFWAHVARLTDRRVDAQEWLRREGPALLRVG